MDRVLKIKESQPSGVVVKFTHSTSVGGPGFTGSDLGCGPTYHSSSQAMAASYVEELEGHTARIYNYVLGLQGEKKKRGRLATDVGSGPIFLTKKKRMSM